MPQEALQPGDLLSVYIWSDARWIEIPQRKNLNLAWRKTDWKSAMEEFKLVRLFSYDQCLLCSPAEAYWLQFAQSRTLISVYYSFRTGPSWIKSAMMRAFIKYLSIVIKSPATLRCLIRKCKIGSTTKQNPRITGPLRDHCISHRWISLTKGH